jgi:catechol 2,3-dioxygenase-like lactoylglutathione lyase family enzyme
MLPATLRIARPLNDLAAMKTFYVDGLGMNVLGSFENHAGFDGIMLGLPSYTWHLEFTYQHGVKVERALSKEHLLVFYFGDSSEWNEAVEKLKKCGAIEVKPENPYWDSLKAATFEDPEGWRVILCNGKWP